MKLFKITIYSRIPIELNFLYSFLDDIRAKGGLIFYNVKVSDMKLLQYASSFEMFHNNTIHTHPKKKTIESSLFLTQESQLQDILLLGGLAGTSHYLFVSSSKKTINKNIKTKSYNTS